MIKMEAMLCVSFDNLSFEILVNYRANDLKIDGKKNQYFSINSMNYLSIFNLFSIYISKRT
jgi:hypothetical protein